MLEKVHIKQFEAIFNLPFTSVTDITYLEYECYDDGIYHFINQETNDVYSFDTDENEWLEMNTHKDEVLNRN